MKSRMLVYRVWTTAVLLAVGAVPVLGQQAESLTLDDAIRIARGNNPLFLSTENDANDAA